MVAVWLCFLPVNASVDSADGASGPGEEVERVGAEGANVGLFT